MKTHTCIVCALLCGLGGTGHADDWLLPGRVLRVIDGDSLVLDVRGSLYQVELQGIDAPELNQPWGTRAADQLDRTLTGAFVVITGVVSDAGQAIRGGLRYKDRDVALDLLHDGLAWSAPPPDPTYRPHYRVAESDARRARRGLWGDQGPVPPWQWRRGRFPASQ